MRQSHYLGVIAGDDGRAEQRREEEFRAWHRRPDATPLPDGPPRRRGWRLGMITMVARTVAVVRAFGR